MLLLLIVLVIAAFGLPIVSPLAFLACNACFVRKDVIAASLSARDQLKDSINLYVALSSAIGTSQK
jgi:hypothetical protein